LSNADASSQVFFTVIGFGDGAGGGGELLLLQEIKNSNKKMKQV
jgi:hypothetical protein